MLVASGCGALAIALLAAADDGGRGRGAAVARAPAAAAPVPAGMVAMFTTPACPDGWQPAAIAAGRMLVGTDDRMGVGHQLGAALGDAEERPHGHEVDTTVALPAKTISAADGGNNSGGAAGPNGLRGSAMPSASGLPFVQLTACVRP